MSWFQKILPPKIKRRALADKKSMPEGLWSKCPACNEVLYRADLESNLEVCPKCGHHHRIGARQRLAMLLDAEGQHEIGAHVTPLDPLKFKDGKKYPDRLKEAQTSTSETDALVDFAPQGRVAATETRILTLREDSGAYVIDVESRLNALPPSPSNFLTW